MIWLPLLAAPKNDPTSPWMVKTPPLPNAAVHDPRVPSARIFAPFGIPGHNPNSPFLGTGSPALVHPIRKMAFCSAAASSLGPSLWLMLNDRATTSSVSAILLCHSRINIYSS